MQSSQTTDVFGTLLAVVSTPQKFKDYIIIVLLSMIGILGTISCLTGEKTTAKSYSIQEMSIAEY